MKTKMASPIAGRSIASTAAPRISGATITTGPARGRATPNPTAASATSSSPSSMIGREPRTAQPEGPPGGGHVDQAGRSTITIASRALDRLVRAGGVTVSQARLRLQRGLMPVLEQRIDPQRGQDAGRDANRAGQDQRAHQ